jgi:glycosyltransferase involved in cell wall biosynthesis
MPPETLSAAPVSEPNRAPLRVLHAVVSLDVGGLERIVVDLVRQGQQLGQEVAVVCVERPGVLAPQVEALGARVFCLHKPVGYHPETCGRMKDVLAEFRPDVVHTHQVGPLLYCGRAARALNVPVVVHTEHIDNIAKTRSLWGRFRQAARLWLGMRHAARFFCVSPDIADQVRAWRCVPRRKVDVVLNGIDTRRFRASDDAAALRRELGIPDGAPVVGTVGRLNEVKRQDLLLRAFARVRERSPGAHLLLVGDGPMMGELRRLAAELGLEDVVHFAGFQSRPERFLHVMSVFALTSRLEGTPLAVLEAWAAGLPVIASRVGGLPQILEHGRSGLFFEPGDLDGLTAALGDLLADPDRARRLAAEGRGLAESRFDLRHMVGNYQRHYADLLNRGGRHCPAA